MDNKKMIVVDLDGTLLNINGNCSNKTKKYLKKLKDFGYIIVIATGRVLRDAVFVTDGAVFANYIISNGGGLIYDMDNKEIISKSEIANYELRRILESYNEEIDYITMCDLYYYNRFGDNDSKMDLFYDRKISDIDKFLDDNSGVFHIIVKFKNSDLVCKYFELFDDNEIDVLVMQDSFVDSRWLEIFGERVSKYNAIKILMDLENISNEDVIAFGDGRNDIDMIKNTGIGVAMGNALDDVKDVSDYVTLSHNEDGVVYFLRKYLEEG